jgi:hypothetical protein
MPAKNAILNLPIKGVNRNFSRGKQPSDTAWDAMNVLPFDRQGRTRIALRGGAGKVLRLAAAAAVQLLHVASFATTPVTGGTTIFNEPFTYANGNLTGKGAWAAIAFEDSWVVSANDAIVQPSTGFNFDWANQNDAAMASLTLATDNYTVTAIVRVNTAANDTLLEFFPEGNNAGDPTVTGNYKVDLQWNGGVVGTGYVNMVDQYSSGALTNFDIPVNADVTVAIVVTGRSVAIKINGTTIQTRAISVTNAAFKRFAFHASTSSLGDGDVTVKSITITTGGAGSLNRSEQKLIAVSGASTYIGTSPSSLAAVANTATFPITASSVNVSAATLYGKTYIVDGTHLYQLNLTTNLFETYTPIAGDPFVSNPTIAVAYRGRLLLSGDATDPQNIAASAIGDPTNWGVLDTPDSAWAANAAKAGRVGAPILALIPTSDDVMLIGTETSLWAVRGDITDGGSIDNVSDSVGVVGQNAWTIAADGSVYFVGPQGLYRTAPNGSTPVEVSRDTYRQFFTGIDRSKNYISVVYDPQRYGIWIFVSPLDSSLAPGTHLFYDIRNEGFWPQKFTHKPDFGPVTSVYWNGFDPADQYPLLGGYVGDIALVSFVNRRDNGDSDNKLIEGYVVVGPFTLNGMQEAVLSRLDVVGGEVLTGDDPSVWHLSWKINAGQSAYSVTEGTPRHLASGNFTFPSRQTSRVQRVRGEWFTIRLGNEFNDGDYFTIEQIAIELNPTGRGRRTG